MAIAVCPRGHDSAEGTYCDVCGSRLTPAPSADPWSSSGLHESPFAPAPEPGAPSPSWSWFESSPASPRPRETLAPPDRPEPPRPAPGRSRPASGPPWLAPEPPWLAPEPPRRAPEPPWLAPEPPRPAPEPPWLAPEPPRPATSFTRTAWTVLIASDRAYYEWMQAVGGASTASVSFPARAVERRIALSGNQMRIGRRSANRDFEPEIDLAEPPADRGVSRLHAALIAGPDGTWSLLDSGSANGTLLNGRRVATGAMVPLREGDRINLGAWTVITVHRG